MKLKYIIKPTEDKTEIKYILKNNIELSENLIKKLKYNSKILCNSIPVHTNHRVSTGDIVEAVIDSDEVNNTIVPEEIDIAIIYEDECLIALNKQPGIVVHPTFNYPSGTIANGLAYYFCKNNITSKVRPISRLDKDTSGIIVFAKNEYIQSSLINQMHKNLYKKKYLGIVNGIVDSKYGIIDLPIERKPDSMILRYTSPSGAHSITKYTVLQFLNNATFLNFSLETGRTHQIRVHCQAINHSLVGDLLYSDIKTELIDRQALHSHKVSFIHPYTKQQLDLSAPLPEDMCTLLKRLSI